MYNTGEKPRTMGIAFGVPTAFIMAVLDQLKLPWRVGEKRPVLSRRMLYQLPEPLRELFY